MNITTKTTYTSNTLPKAPARETLAEAEADERRGEELAAYMDMLTRIDAAAWDEAWDEARVAAWDAAWDAVKASAWVAAWDASWVAPRVAAWDASWLAPRVAAWGAAAILARDLITEEQFETLVAPMRAAGINFDELDSNR